MALIASGIMVRSNFCSSLLKAFLAPAPGSCQVTLVPYGSNEGNEGDEGHESHEGDEGHEGHESDEEGR